MRGPLLPLLVVPILLVSIVGTGAAGSGKEQSTFYGSTYTNEHFVMEILADESIIYSLDERKVKATSVNWVVEKFSGRAWEPLDWISPPLMKIHDWG
ncbi:MAG: hypothetical protein R3291_03125, partial [Thermoplasmata archaeon]|nr:hypothetical protein [Thermoplasmata archaeon]